MSTRALVVLEDLRRDEVEHARRALASLRSSHEQASAAAQAAAAGEAHCRRALSGAQQDFASARTVLALRAAEALLSVARDTLARAVQRREHSLLCLRERKRAVQLGEARLLTVELARRSVARTLEQRAADVSLRTERRHEDDSDDAFRALSHSSAGSVVGRRAALHQVLAAPASGARGAARGGSH